MAFVRMSAREDLQEFMDLLRDMREEVDGEGAVLLVEGERDRGALQALGFPTGSILLVHHGVTLALLVEQVVRKGRKVIILTDWDRAGGELAHRLRSLFDDGRIRFDLDYRRRLARAVRGETQYVEAVLPWAERTARRAGAPLEHWLTPLRTMGAGAYRET
jgi:5S rRNA maturation endonuclease (ribonuclease M5)